MSKNAELIHDRVRLRTSKGVFATYLGPPLPLAWCRARPLFGARWQPGTPSGSQPCRREACLRQTASVVSASEVNPNEMTLSKRDSPAAS